MSDSKTANDATSTSSAASPEAVDPKDVVDSAEAADPERVSQPDKPEQQEQETAALIPAEANNRGEAMPRETWNCCLLKVPLQAWPRAA